MNSSGWNYDTPTSRPWKLDINNDDTVTIDTYQDVQSIIDNNKLSLNNYGDKLTFGKASKDHVAASIPLNIWEMWCILITNTSGLHQRGFNHVAISTHVFRQQSKAYC